MQVQKRYLKAPITEAIIDLKVTFPEDFSADRFAEIEDRVKDRFPTQEKEQIYRGVGAFIFELGSPVKVDANQHHNGFLFRSTDGLRIFQATLSGFTFNRLAPYESWGEFSHDAKYLWEAYKEIYKPIQVTRAAIRYVNQIHIPTEGLVDLKDYLRVLPEVSEDLPQKTLHSFFTQLQIPQEDLECMLIISETLVPQPDPKFITVTLDLDLFRQQNWESGDEDIWNFLEKLHNRKNEVFEACITQRAKEMFGEC
jgi:uncharacterized protein (TIGR04255 family)